MMTRPAGCRTFPGFAFVFPRVVSELGGWSILVTKPKQNRFSLEGVRHLV